MSGLDIVWIVQMVMIVEVPYQVRYNNVFKNLAEYTGE